MGHTHDHSQTNFGRAFAIGVALNVAFVLVGHSMDTRRTRSRWSLMQGII